ADDEQGHVLRPLREVPDEIEQRLVAPVQVLEDEHRLASGCKTLEVPPPGGERLLGLGGRPSLDAGERRESLNEPLALRSVRRKGRVELLQRHLRRVRLENR